MRELRNRLERIEASRVPVLLRSKAERDEAVRAALGGNPVIPDESLNAQQRAAVQAAYRAGAMGPSGLDPSRLELPDLRAIASIRLSSD